MNNEELYKRILNKVCIHFGYDVAHQLEYLFLEKEKEIDRLKAREQECIDKYLAESKYRGEIEGKYVLAKYVIDELEKWLKDVDVFQMNFIENKEHITPYKAVLEKIKELKEGKE